MKAYKAPIVEMIAELESRRHRMEYSDKADIGLKRADGLLKKIIEWERARFYVPPEYGRCVFTYKEYLEAFIRTSYSHK